MNDPIVKVAYRAWRSAQRGTEVPEAEFEATYSRVEGEWMSQVVAAIREQIAGDIGAAEGAAWAEGRERTALAFRRAGRIARGEE